MCFHMNNMNQSRSWLAHLICDSEHVISVTDMRKFRFMQEQKLISGSGAKSLLSKHGDHIEIIFSNTGVKFEYNKLSCARSVVADSEG